VRFELAFEQLAFLGLDENWLIEPGTIEVMLGSSSDDVRLAGTFEISGPVVPLRRRTRFTTPAFVESVS
jgi:beta-glucosidase